MRSTGSSPSPSARPQAGIWGGRTLHGDRTLNPGSVFGRVTLWSLFCRASGLALIFKRSAFFNPEEMGAWDRGDERDVDVVQGSFFLIRRDLWEHLGGFDPVFVMYGEEQDLCRRARAAGARPRMTPEATIVHYHGASSRRADREIMTLKARVTLIRRHFPAWQRPLGAVPARVLALEPHGQRRRAGAAQRPSRASPRPPACGATSGGRAPTGAGATRRTPEGSARRDGCNGPAPCHLAMHGKPARRRRAANRRRKRWRQAVEQARVVRQRRRGDGEVLRPAGLGEHRDEHHAVGVAREGPLEQPPRQRPVESRSRSPAPPVTAARNPGSAAARALSAAKAALDAEDRVHDGAEARRPRRGQERVGRARRRQRRLHHAEGGADRRSRRARPRRRSPPPPPAPCRRRACPRARAAPARSAPRR